MCEYLYDQIVTGSGPMPIVSDPSTCNFHEPPSY